MALIPVVGAAQILQAQQAAESFYAYLGGLRPVQETAVSAVEPGVVATIDLKPGDVVAIGQTIAELDSDSYSAQLRVAQAELETARIEAGNDVDLQYAQNLRNVNESVYKKSMEANERYPKTVSSTELDRLRLEARRAELSTAQAEMQRETRTLNVDVKKATLQLAEVKLSHRKVVSPIKGTVVEVFFQPGEHAAVGQPIARIINLDQLQVSSQVSIDDLMPHQVAKQATFRVEIDRQVFEFPAEVTFASPEISWTRKTFLVTAQVDNSERKLYSGQFGRLILKRQSD